MFEAQKPWNIEKLDIVKKSNIKEPIREGLKQYEYIKMINIILPDLNIFLFS